VLEALAAVAVDEGSDERALYLGGAAEGLRRSINVVYSWPLHREHHRRLQALRASNEKAWVAGEAMPRDEAIALALMELGEVGASLV
jgi:hypothetical protein